jgi:SAM-dependent methyltransferase
MVDPRLFWNEKILIWEKDKYDKHGIIDFNSSLKFRQFLAVDFLSMNGEDQVVVELGCGSGRLLPHIAALPIKKYIGIDISSAAIERAKQRLAKLNLAFEVEFTCAEIGELDLPECNICLSLGLLDWIALEEIENLIKDINCDIHLHSFSEDKVSFSRYLHKLYVFLMYGRKTQAYVPNYYSKYQIEEIFLRQGKGVEFIEHPQLSFGCYVLSGEKVEATG